MIVHYRYLVPKGYRSITLFPFIFLNDADDRKDKVLLNHEKIHLRQQAELLVIPFYIWYGIEFIFLYFKYKDRQKAYRNISFEREAYYFEGTPDYLSNRKYWAFRAF